MANVKISDLPTVSSITPTVDYIPIVSGGTIKKATVNQIIASNTTLGNMSLQNSSSITATDLILSGSLGIGSKAAGNALTLSKSITGATTARAVWVSANILSDVTTNAFGFATNISTQATSFTIPTIVHYYANQGAKGLTSTINTQYGVLAEASLVDATNNYAFFGNIPAGTGRWNLYMSGTASNYLAGSLQVGGYFYNSYNTGSGIYPALLQGGAQGWNFQSGAGEVDYWNTFTAANTSFTWRQMTTASAATLLMSLSSTGSLGFGAPANASAILDAQSTTKGIRFPNMTTTQKTAIPSPAAGLVIFDTTAAKLCVYTGTVWQTITSV